MWEFEYANILSPEIGLYFNFGDLRTYGEELKDTICRVRALNPGVNVNIIAHSLGGLVARYAAQDERSIRLSHWIPDISDLRWLSSLA